MPILEVKNITKKFPGVIALGGVDLQLEESEVLSVIGENGAGKSTLMKLLLRFYSPTSGCLKLDGTDLTQLKIPDLRRAFGAIQC